jgi:hypothetical protein
MSFSDGSTWLACGAALLALVAVLPWWIDGGGLRWKGLRQAFGAGGIAVALVVANWLVGGAWATALSRLGDPASDAGDLEEYEGSYIPPGFFVAIVAVPAAAVAVIAAFWAWLF